MYKDIVKIPLITNMVQVKTSHSRKQYSFPTLFIHYGVFSFVQSIVHDYVISNHLRIGLNNKKHCNTNVLKYSILITFIPMVQLLSSKHIKHSQH
jgi:hypothetical protein